MVRDAREGTVRAALWPGIFLGVGSVAGCTRAEVDDYVRQDQPFPFWLFVLPLVFAVLLGAVSVGLRYSGLLQRLDLRVSPVDPGLGRGFLVGYVTAVVLVSVSFTIFSFMVEDIDPAQRLQNIMWWWFGSTTGGIVGWFSGRWCAVWAFERRWDAA